MNENKEKFVVQIVICCMIFVTAKGLSFVPGEQIREIKEEAMSRLERNYSIEELKEMGGRAIRTVKKVPLQAVNFVIQANADDLSESQNHSGNLQPVYAAADGTVAFSGISAAHGMAIKIRHEKKVSTCGNLSKLNVVTGETVKRGDCIGYYDKDSHEDLYYDTDSLHENRI